MAVVAGGTGVVVMTNYGAGGVSAMVALGFQCLLFIVYYMYISHPFMTSAYER